LEVQIGGETTLNQDNIREKYYEYKSRLSTERDYIDAERMGENFESLLAILEGDKDGETKVPDLDSFHWHLKLLDKDSESRTRVAIARKDGMLIKHNPILLERFPSMLPFEMYVCVDGTRGSKLLKRIENPRHDGFDFNRVDDEIEREELRKKYKRITNKIREIIKRLWKILKKL